MHNQRVDRSGNRVIRRHVFDLTASDCLRPDRHKRGRELGQYCQDLLARAQQQVRVLEENTLKNIPGDEPDA